MRYEGNTGLLPFGTMYLTGYRTPVLDQIAKWSLENSDSSSMKIPVGMLVQPLTRSYFDDGHLFYEYAAIDNGCFTEVGQARYSEDSYFALIDRGLETFGDDLLFATARDVPFDWEGTLRLSLPVLPKLRALGVPAALCVQNGATVGNIPWSECDCIFIGGDTEWKLSETARQITEEAKRRKQWVHMGRVNSMKRMRIAQDFGCDSADGTYLLHMAKGDDLEQGIENVMTWLRDMWLHDKARPLHRGYTYNRRR